MAEELKPVAFNVEPYRFELIATESDCKISDDIRPTAMASKVLVKFTGERLNLFIHYTVKVCRRIVNKNVTTYRCLLLCLTN